jgi:formimidoylglutamase
LKSAEYPAPAYRDPNDRRLTQLIKRSSRAKDGAVNIIGIPYDGAVLGRKGAAGGPRAIRESMGSFSNYNVELGQGLEKARIFDLGDLEVDARAGVLEVHSKIEAVVSECLVGGSLLVILGGDNSVSLPALRASAKKARKLGLIVIDSHFDLRGKIKGKPTSGSSYGLALEEIRGLGASRMVEVGIHGFLNSRRYYDRARRSGIGIFTALAVRRLGPKKVATEAYRRASKGADGVYLSVDLDSVDLGQVSGVSAPSVGGITAEELLTLVYEIARNRKVCAADIVELAPALDPTGRSQRVAAAVLTYLIAGFNAR